MLVYSVTIFLSAFLLFLVQPVIAKMILPWFGGSAAVWTTCLVFFQSLLLVGYLYAHATTRRLPPRVQVMMHLSLIAASLLLLPMVPDPDWKPAGNEDPSLRILMLLGASVGLPYFLLSTTGPLMQVWYTRTFQSAIPYRLFALSNLASLAALLAYPVLVEPWTSSRSQALAWSAGYVAFAGMCAAAALRTRSTDGSLHASGAKDSPRFAKRLLWMLLAGCASLLLVSVTNHLTHNVASIPFLWILPLTLYLLSFILCFDREGWYRRGTFVWIVSLALAAMSFGLLIFEPAWTLEVTIPVFSLGLFICCMFCHGELALRKPPAAHLTAFYLMVSLGGAAGAIFTGLLAPRLFENYMELPIGIVLCSLLAAFMFYRRRTWANLALLYVLVGAIFCSVMYERMLAVDVRLAARNFYGELRVMDADGVRLLLHGAVNHGGQFLKPDLRREPTTYFGRESGVAHALAAVGNGPKRVGVIGLGAGTLAAYGKEGDVFRFYEINPRVIDIAQREFSFLSDSPARIEVVLGDGRLSLERERPQQYDLLVVDAFSGDSIPAHLLSREAIGLYFRHLKPGALLAMHISNASLDLWPVVRASAISQNKDAVLIVNSANKELSVSEAVWAIVAEKRELLDRPPLRLAAFRPQTRRLRVWTDDYSNLFQILK
jgi:hypothetical protein